MVKQKPERIQTPAVARILGITSKTVREMAARGDLPSAARIGQRWTFNEARIGQWLSEQEARAQQPRWHPLNDRALDEAYEREIGLSRPGVIRHRERQKQKLAKE